MNTDDISTLPIDFLADLNLRMSVEDFMKKLLEAALKISPDYDRGIVIMKSEGGWRCVARVGFRDDADIRDRREFVPESEDPVVIKIIGTPSVKKTISVAIRSEDETVGAFFLDSVKEDADVSESMIRTIKNFGKIASVFTTMKIHQERERKYQKDIIKAMIRMLEIRERYTVGHSERVAKYAVAVAREIGLDRDLIDAVYWGSMIHDIGKIAVPDHILLKPSRLSPAEYELVKAHTLVGERIVKDYRWLDNLRKIIRNHHERWDGKGYPDALKGIEIPVEVRVVSLADAFDAMTSDRSYRKAMDLAAALYEIEHLAGYQFDPEITRAALSVLEREYRLVNR